jgi:hypothetical protein
VDNPGLRCGIPLGFAQKDTLLKLDLRREFAVAPGNLAPDREWLASG